MVLTVVPLDSLPPDGIDHEPVQGRVCGCAVCLAADDWRVIAHAAVECVENGAGPHDFTAIVATVKRNGLDQGARGGWHVGDMLGDPIVVHGEEYLNGRHRTHACRVAGADHIVVDFD
jgi:hypothetical protein